MRFGERESYSDAFLHAFHLSKVRFRLSLLGPLGPTIDYPLIPKLHRRSFEALLRVLSGERRRTLPSTMKTNHPLHAYMQMSICTSALTIWSVLAHHPTPISTRLVVAVNLCQPACMSMREGTSESFGSYRCTHFMYVNICAL